MNKTQKQYVKSVLLNEGCITRNHCLARYISRLGAIICTLKAEGMEIEGKKAGGDYEYTLLNRKPRVVGYERTPNGMRPIYG